MVVEAAHWRFTVDDYHKMAEAGILCEDDPVELIDGEIVRMSPIGSRHVASVGLANESAHAQIPRSSAFIISQSPIRLDENSEPEPDLTVLRFRVDHYAGALPKPEDVLLILEVADSSLAYDRRTKLPLYAEAGIPESWLLDLDGEALERHTDPAGGRYGTVARAVRGQELASTTVEGLVLRVDELLD